MHIHQSHLNTIAAMPDMNFGEDKGDYCRRMIAWGREQNISMRESLECASFKWQSWEVSNLLERIEAGDDAALRRGVAMLLKDRFIV